MAVGGASMVPALHQEDHDRLRMGRLLVREEHEGRLLVEGHAGGRYLQRLLGVGVNWTRPAVRSSRPRTVDGRQSFVFRHRTVSKRRWLSAKQSRSGQRKLVGVGPGTTKKFAAYIRRDNAVEHHDGEPSVAGSEVAYHPGLWDAIEARERRDGRIQSRIVAELPYEREIGPEGRRRILEGLGKEFDAIGLPWMGAVHRPDAHSDQRNYHLHLIYHDRPAYEQPDGSLRFLAVKCPRCRDRDFIPDLRKRYAALVNEEFERAGLDRRWDPRRYDQMGIAKQPGEHLGVKAAALERKGIATNIGSRNAAREFDYRLGLTGRKVCALAEETGEATRDVFDLVPDALGKIAHQEFVDAAQALIEATEEFIHARTGEAAARLKLDLALWMAEATPSRFEQVAANRTLEPATTARLAHQLRLRADDECIRAIDDANTAEYRVRQATHLLEEAWQRFNDERRVHNWRFQRRAQAWLKKREAQYERAAAAAASDVPKPAKVVPPADQQSQGLVRQTADASPHVPEDRAPPSGRVDTDQAITPSRSTTGPPGSSAQPSDEVVEPLKLREGQDAAPLLDKKPPEQLLAIRQVTAEELAKRSHELGHWATVQAQLLRRGLKALDAQLKAQGVETGRPKTKSRRRPHGFEL